MITLRPYQAEAIDAARNYLRAEPKGNPLISIPTGGGKGLIAAELLRGVKAKKRRAIYLTMSKELVSQTLADLTNLAPEVGLSATLACAELAPVDLSGDIVLGTPQSVFRRLGEIGDRDLIVVDECQLIPRDEGSMYQKIFQHVPKTRVGLTATPFRLDSGRLDEGDGAPFSKTVYTVPTSQLQKSGHLCKLVYRKAKMEVSTLGVHIRQGEFVVSELEEFALNQQLCAEIAADLREAMLRDNRRSTILFCVSITHARMMAQALNAIGTKAAHVSSEDGKEHRSLVIGALKSGNLEVMCCVQVGMIGLDVPRLDMVAWARPTASTGLWIQGCGRGLRMFKGKPNCMIRDYAGNIFRHGPVEDVERGAVKRGNDRAKLCVACEAVLSRSAVQCPECGAVQPVQARSLQEQERKVVLDLNRGEWIAVDSGSFGTTVTTKGQPALKCTFRCNGKRVYSLWIQFTHGNTWAQHYDRTRWMALGGEAPFPRDVQDAHWRATFGQELKVPREILVRKAKKSDFIEVIDVDL
jgi:DNA repair protein RadD